MTGGREPFDDVLPHEHDDVLPHEDSAGEDEHELAEKRPHQHSPLPPARPYSRAGVGFGFSRTYELVRKTLVWVVLLGVFYIHAQCCGILPMLGELAAEHGGAPLVVVVVVSWMLVFVAGPLVAAVLLRHRVGEWLGFASLNASYRRMSSAIARACRVTVSDCRRVGIVFGTARQYPPGEFEEYLGLLEVRPEELVLWWYANDTVGVFRIPKESVTWFGPVEHWYDVRRMAVRPDPDPYAPLIGYTDTQTEQTRWFSLESGSQVAPRKIAAATGGLYHSLRTWLGPTHPALRR